MCIRDSYRTQDSFCPSVGLRTLLDAACHAGIILKTVDLINCSDRRTVERIRSSNFCNFLCNPGRSTRINSWVCGGRLPSLFRAGYLIVFGSLYTAKRYTDNDEKHYWKLESLIFYVNGVILKALAFIVVFLSFLLKHKFVDLNSTYRRSTALHWELSVVTV